MISKTEIKKIRSLNTKKGRDLHNLILIEGKRLVNQVIQSEFNINKVWITDDFYNKNTNLIYYNIIQNSSNIIKVIEK